MGCRLRNRHRYRGIVDLFLISAFFILITVELSLDHDPGIAAADEQPDCISPGSKIVRQWFVSCALRGVVRVYQSTTYNAGSHLILYSIPNIVQTTNGSS